jgi:hypothetical protein
VVTAVQVAEQSLHRHAQWESALEVQQHVAVVVQQTLQAQEEEAAAAATNAVSQLRAWLEACRLQDRRLLQLMEAAVQLGTCGRETLGAAAAVVYVSSTTSKQHGRLAARQVSSSRSAQVVARLNQAGSCSKLEACLEGAAVRSAALQALLLPQGKAAAATTSGGTGCSDAAGAHSCASSGAATAVHWESALFVRQHSAVFVQQSSQAQVEAAAASCSDLQ